MSHARQQPQSIVVPSRVGRFDVSITLACLLLVLAPRQFFGQTARTTANQGTGAHYGWQDPDGYADGANHLSLLANDNQIVIPESRVYNTVGDPVPGANLPAYNNTYAVTFQLSASTPTLPPNNNSTVTAFLTTEYSTNSGGSWFSVGGTSQVVASRSTAGVTTTVQTFTVNLSNVGGAPVWIRLILRGTASGTLPGGAVTVVATNPYAVTWSNTPGTPVVDVSPYNFDKQDYSRCASTCFAATYAQSTVPYFSMDVPRNVALAYNGDRMSPRAFVHVNVRPDPYYAGTPTQYQLQVKVNSALVTFVNQEQTLHFAYPGDTVTVRLAAEFYDSTLATGVYPMDILVSVLYGSTLITRDIVTSLTVVNETNSPIARGWTLPGFQKLYIQADGSALVTEGDGSAVYFKKQGSAFVSPAGEFSQLITSSLSGTSGWARILPDSSKIVFDNAGKMVQLRDRFNNIDSVKYDASARVTQIKDPAGLAITLAYGTNGLSTITDPGSPARVTNITVDASHRLTLVRDPDGLSTTFGYDANLRLSTITDRNGKTATLGYDTQASTLSTITNPTILLYDGSNVAPVLTLSAWEKIGIPYSRTDSAPPTPPVIDSVLAILTEPGQEVSRFTANRWGSPRRAIDALGHVILTTYDANGLPVRTSYPNGAVDSTTYNAKGLPTFVQTADATNRRYFTYNSTWNQPDSVWGGPAPAAHAWIGQGGRVDSLRVAGDTQKSKFVYNSSGRLVSITDPNGNLSVKHWFSGANANTSQDSVPGGWLTNYYYDSYGRDTATKAPVTPARRVHYDVLNRTIQSYDGYYATPTTISYDSLDHVTRVIVKSQTYSFAYNALGWLIARTDPTGLADSLKYNRDGDLMKMRDRRGQTVNIAYDALHRSTAKSGTNVDSISWRFSADGRVDTSTTSVATTVNYLNIRGQLDSVKIIMAGQIFWKRYHYTTRGIQDSLRISGAGIAFRPRAYSVDTTRFVLAGIRLGSATAGSTSLSYDPAGNRTSATYRGATVSMGYDSRERMGSISSTASFGDSVLRMLEFDGEGRLTRSADDGGTHARKFTYDALGRLSTDSEQAIVGNPPPECDGNPPPLLGADGTNCLDFETWQTTGGTLFSYDSLGNRTDHTGTYTTGNRIQGFAGCTYQTDSDGNVTSRRCPGDTVTFKWSGDGLLDTMIVAGRTVSYRYDADGFPIRKDSAGIPSRYFLWDGGNILAELTGTADSERAEFSFFPGLDRPHAIVFGGNEYDEQTDEIGNVIALTDSAQAVRRGYSFDDWGNLLATGGDLSANGAERSRFKGSAFLGDEANLYYMRARWYEPATGRFLSEDPIGLNGGSNLYTYANNDPIDLTDPNGTCEWVQAQVYIELADGTEVLVSGGWYCDGDAGMEALGDAILTAGRPGFGGPGGAAGGGARAGVTAAVVKLGTQPNACWGAFAKLAANAVIDAWALTGIGEGAFLILKGVGRLGAGALLSASARSVAAFGVDVAGKQAFLRTSAAGASAVADLAASEMTRGGFRAVEGYAPDATFAAAGGASAEHSLSLWDLVPGHGTWVAWNDYLRCRRGQ